MLTNNPTQKAPMEVNSLEHVSSFEKLKQIRTQYLEKYVSIHFIGRQLRRGPRLGAKMVHIEDTKSNNISTSPSTLTSKGV